MEIREWIWEEWGKEWKVNMTKIFYMKFSMN